MQHVQLGLPSLLEHLLVALCSAWKKYHISSLRRSCGEGEWGVCDLDDMDSTSFGQFFLRDDCSNHPPIA